MFTLFACAMITEICAHVLVGNIIIDVFMHFVFFIFQPAFRYHRFAEVAAISKRDGNSSTRRRCYLYKKKRNVFNHPPLDRGPLADPRRGPNIREYMNRLLLYRRVFLYTYLVRRLLFDDTIISRCQSYGTREHFFFFCHVCTKSLF